MTTTAFNGLDLDELQRVLDEGIDHGGNPVEPYTDENGGWPLRCCLGFSNVGDEIALIAWSPFEWTGVYAETGPVFVHTSPCSGPATTDELPAELDGRPMVLRPYTHDRRIAYHRVAHVPEGESLGQRVTELLAHEDVDFVHGRNVTGGCFSFEARRLES